MRTYVYYGYLSNEAYQKLASANAKVVIAPADMSSSISKDRKKSQAMEVGLYVLVVLVGALGGSMPSGPSIPKTYQSILRAQEGAITAAKSNPVNTFYTGDAHFEIDVDERQLDLKHVEVFENGKKVKTRTWTDRFPESTTVAQAKNAGANPNNPKVPIMCYFISPTPPEVVHQQHQLQFGLVTRYHDDVERFFQVLNEQKPSKFNPHSMEQAEEAAPSGFQWPDNVQATIEPKDIDTLIDRIPRDLFHTVDPKKLGIKDHALSHQYQQIVKLYDDLLKRLHKADDESKFFKFARTFSSIIPFLTINTYSTDDEKALDVYYRMLDSYKVALKQYLSKADNIDVKQFQLLLEKVIQGRTFYDIFKRFDKFMLKRANPEELLKEFKSHETYEVYLAELKESYRKLSDDNSPGSFEDYRNTILNTFISLQRTYSLDEQTKFNDLIDKTMQHLAKLEKIPIVSKFESYTLFENYGEDNKKEDGKKEIDEDDEIKLSRKKPME